MRIFKKDKRKTNREWGNLEDIKWHEETRKEGKRQRKKESRKLEIIDNDKNGKEETGIRQTGKENHEKSTAAILGEGVLKKNEEN